MNRADVETMLSQATKRVLAAEREAAMWRERTEVAVKKIAELCAEVEYYREEWRNCAELDGETIVRLRARVEELERKILEGTKP